MMLPVQCALRVVLFSLMRQRSRIDSKTTSTKCIQIGNDFKKFRDEKAKQTTILSFFRQTYKRQKYGLIASYNISKLIAKTAKPHTMGKDLVLPFAK